MSKAVVISAKNVYDLANEIATVLVNESLKQKDATIAENEEFNEFEYDDFYQSLFADVLDVHHFDIIISDEESEEIKDAVNEVLLNAFCFNDIPGPFDFRSHFIKIELDKEWVAWWFLYPEENIAYLQVKKKDLCV